jgi:hypothetical protein
MLWERIPAQGILWWRVASDLITNSLNQVQEDVAGLHGIPLWAFEIIAE